MRATLKIALAFVLVSLAMGAAPAAHAACKRFGFTVNDYGKEGPIRDAKALLDKHIATWAAEKGVKDYQVGKKDVSCELFLNFIVFDEHTCTASANVCWGGDHVANPEHAESGKPPAPVRKAAAESATAKPAKAAAENATAKPSKAELSKAEVSKKSHSKPIASEITLDGRDVGHAAETAAEPAESNDEAAAAAAAPAAAGAQEDKPAEAAAAAPSADDKGAPELG